MQDIKVSFLNGTNIISVSMEEINNRVVCCLSNPDGKPQHCVFTARLLKQKLKNKRRKKYNGKRKSYY